MSLNNFPKHQTVAWWIEQLQEMSNKDAIVYAFAGRGDAPLCMLSLYEGNNENEVFLDVGEPENYD